MKNSILVHAWRLQKYDDKYYIPYTHWVYLNEIVKYYNKVWLLSPIRYTDCLNNGFIEINSFPNVAVYELPNSNGYIDTIKHFFSYYKGYRELSSKCQYVYTRYPGPFGWLQKFFFKNENRIIHYVGDPMDTIINNPNLSPFEKNIYRLFFKPESFLYDLASRKAIVYTNGHHIANKLKKRKINAIPIISSTLNKEDFYFKEKTLDKNNPKYIYVGYLRKAKGVETVLKGFHLLQQEVKGASLTIVGTGENEKELKNLVKLENIQNVVFTGHIEQRNELNELLRSHDVFVFGSLSEGSPRVILEAMANGLAVISTPVGSLPSTFIEGNELLFVDFNNDFEFFTKMKEILDDEFYSFLRFNAFNKVKKYTIDGFLKKIFNNA